MDIDNIEKNLSTFNSEYSKILNAILNTCTKNQAILQTILDIQCKMLDAMNLDTEKNANDQAGKRIVSHLLKIQAELQSKLL